jgi:hypothetical protein
MKDCMQTSPQISLIPQKLGIIASVKFVQSVAGFLDFADIFCLNACPHA